jgi:hypothetical protein
LLILRRAEVGSGPGDESGEGNGEVGSGPAAEGADVVTSVCGASRITADSRTVRRDSRSVIFVFAAHPCKSFVSVMVEVGCESVVWKT